MKIAIMTNFQEFLPGYSLTGIVKDQITMLRRHGHEAHLYVSEKYNGEEFSPGIPVHKKVPFAHLTDYTSIKYLSPEHKMTAKATAKVLKEELSRFDMVWTHDWIFTGWNVPYGLGCQLAWPDMPGTAWLHWIHSVPSHSRDFWQIRAYGPRAKIVFPNRTDALLVAEQFKGEIDDVRPIHHIKDLRTFYDFSADTWRLIDLVPQVMSADVVQVLPASADRLSAKRVKEVITIFGHINRRVNEVCLLIANQWATERQHKEDIAKYYEHAKACGLEPGRDVVFTSDVMPEYRVGIPKRMIRELLLCSNLFIFPTREESFGLVVPEAALHGVQLVLNRSLTQQYEVAGHNALFFDFGSYRHEHHNKMGDRYYAEIAIIILGKMAKSDVIRSKTFARKCYNMDYLYRTEYEPVMGESLTWGRKAA